MAHFIGTREEFDNFIGNYFKSKAGWIGELTLNNIIDKILTSSFRIAENYYNADLTIFEELFSESIISVTKSFTIGLQTAAPLPKAPINKLGKQKEFISEILMQDGYSEWLLKYGYAQNTTLTYSSSINKVCKEENYTTWFDIQKNISQLINNYEPGGKKAHIGKIGNSTVINALRRFREFLYID